MHPHVGMGGRSYGYIPDSRLIICKTVLTSVKLPFLFPNGTTMGCPLLGRLAFDMCQRSQTSNLMIRIHTTFLITVAVIPDPEVED